MQLSRIDDPRSPVEKLTRQELKFLARKEGRRDIDPSMPAKLMQKKFRDSPPRQWPRPMCGPLGSMRPLRMPPYNEWLKVAFQAAPMPEPAAQVEEVNELTDLERQWNGQKQKPPETMGELRSACKRLGIPIKRTDKMTDLKAKLDGQNAAQCG